jgi:peroxiredoxin
MTMSRNTPLVASWVITWLIAILLFVGAAWVSGHAAPFDEAPNVTLRPASGDPLHLADLRGHVVLVDFWASWCPPCQKSFPALDTLYRRLHTRGLDVLAVNVDEHGKDADAFLTEHPHTMPVFLDPHGDAAKAFHIAAMPTSVLIDRAGRIRFTHNGYTASVDAAYEREISALLKETSQ